MVAVVSGSGTGLANSSFGTLGSKGALGNATEGKAGEQVYVNSTNGDLIVQDRDEALAALGLNLSIVRTYNSQGQLADDFGGEWRLSVNERLFNLTGTVNTAGSTITKAFGDESQTVYTYDATQSKYVSTGKAGAQDELTYNSGNQRWTWTDGDARNSETYDSNGRLLTSTDTAGNTRSYIYTGSLLTQATDASGQNTYLDYSGNNLTQIRVVTQGQTQTLARYGYDSSNRLTSVKVDLSPQDNSISDGKIYTTTYTYEGTSNRISSIVRSDGTSVSFTYELSGGVYRVKTYTESDGGVTTASANLSSLVTSETQTTTTNYNVNSSALTAPNWNGPVLPTSFPSSVSTYSYLNFDMKFDANGNGVALWGLDGSLSVYRYTAATDTWSAPQTLASGVGILSSGFDVDSQGNAIVTWTTVAAGPANTLSAAILNPSTGVWTTQTVRGATDTVSARTVSIKGNQAVITYVRSGIPTGSNNTVTPDGTVFAITFNGTSWSSPVAISSDSVNWYNSSNGDLSVAIDAQGNVSAAWKLQSTVGSDTAFYIRANHFSASTGAWAGQATLDQGHRSSTASDVLSPPQVLLDKNGVPSVYWQHGTSSSLVLQSSAFSSGSNTWAATPTTLVPSSAAAFNMTSLAKDGNGNYIVAWRGGTGPSSGSIYAMRYDAALAQWGSVAQISGPLNYNLTGVAINGTAAVVSCNVASYPPSIPATSTNYAAVLTDGVWSSIQPVSQPYGPPTYPAPDPTVLAVLNSGDVVATWRDRSNYVEHMFVNRFRSHKYYSVPAGATWASIGQALYGSPDVAAQLQAAMGNPTLVPGSVLSNPPATISVSGTMVVPVTPYYLVPASATWTSVAQAVYGTSDANAVGALQIALGNPALTTGAKLTVPLTLNYTPASAGRVTTLTYSTSGANSLQTDVQSPTGLITTLVHDGTGRLVQTLTPTVGSARLKTNYGYDANGNLTSLTEDPDTLNRTTIYQYDTKGNLLLKRDAAGNTVSRIYGTANQILTETVYTTPDPDGAGTGQPAGPQTVRYAYDAKNELRFVVSAQGDVTEYRYNASGQRVASLVYGGGAYDISALTPTSTLSESTLTTWAAAQNQTLIQRTDYTYDFRGQLATQIQYTSTDNTGAGVVATASTTQYVYDQRGYLLKTITPRGNGSSDPAADSTVYTYDGLGRVLTATTWLATGNTSATVNQYDDANNKVVTTSANGLVTTTVYDAAGEVTSVKSVDTAANVLDAKTYAYDREGHLRMATDGLGNRTYTLYDAAGRKSATIAADGALTQFVYDGANQLVKTVEYADRLTSATLATLVDSQGAPANVSVATLVTSLASVPGRNAANDRISRLVYDTAGRVVYSIDPQGAVTQNSYDGVSRLTDQIKYANLVTISASVDQLTPAGVTVTTNALDRHSRSLYDADGRTVGSLDAAGYLVEYQYDSAGRLILQTAYATLTTAGVRFTGTLAQLRPAADATNDITSRFFYDNEGRRVGVLDGAGYLTETVYDLDGNVSQLTRYDQVLTYAAGATLTSLKSAILPASARHTTSYQYDGAREVTQKTDYQGTVTGYVYDTSGHLVNSTEAQGSSSAYTTQDRYDALGRVTAELSPVGSAAITAGMTPAQIESIWSSYGVKYTYDLAGHRASATDENGKTTLYFYDVDGRLVFTVDPDGEVTETRYNALGQITDTINYANRIATASLVGGPVNAALQSRVTAAADAVHDSHKTFTYALIGAVASSTTAEGANTAYTYSAFGDVATRIDKINSTQSFRRDYTYDARGALTLTRSDQPGLNTTESETYDAFGRMTSVTDRNGNISRTQYDRLGRQVTTTDALTNSRITTYDAFSRKLTARDELGNTTTYSYNDTTFTITATTPQGISTVTTLDQHGRAVSVAVGSLTTQYFFDENSRLIKTTENGVRTESDTYDNAGRKQTFVDANGTTTSYTYDGENRVLTKTVDSVSGGLALQTSYTYDAQGRVVQVVDPNGRVTKSTYDRDGNLVQIDVDPTGTDIRTMYTYDLEGHVLTVVEAANTAAPRRTQYTYDTLGRRTQEVVDPTSLGGTLNLVTAYKYDPNGNVSRKIDAAGNSTWYVYDADNQLRYTVGALGGVTETRYDADGQVISTRRYVAAVATASFGDVVKTITIATAAGDRFQQTAYDKDGRSVYSIDATGAVTERQFDANGRVTRERIYSDRIATGTYATTAAVATALGAVRADINAIGAADRVTWTAYDGRGNAGFTVDNTGAVIQRAFDANGNVTTSTAFATLHTSGAMDYASLSTWASGATTGQDRVTRYWYDTANRQRFLLDASGYLHETRYDDVGRQQYTFLYGNGPLSFAAGATLSTVVATVSTMAGSQQITTTFDLQGRITRVTDPVGQFESYTYDQLGNKLTYTNKSGSVWNYTYDANGRLTHEITPPVAVTTVSGTSTLSASTTASVRLDTAYTYNALGDVLSRTEAYGTAQARVTTYEYDALGRQIRTRYPAIGVYNAAGDNPTRVGTAVVRSDTAQNLYTEIAYDNLGNAYRSRDKAGNYSFKTYDTLGRVQYSVDAANYVTGYTYDAFGNQTKLTRYATALSAALSTTAIVTSADVTSKLTASASTDRSISTSYDALNRVVQVTQPAALSLEANLNSPGGTTFTAGATTITEYNAFGQVVRSRQLVNPLTSSYADSYFYYDRLGNKVAEVDPLGYITTYTYDGAGNIATQYQYAKALAAGSWSTSTYGTPVATNQYNSLNDSVGYDRKIIYGYDALNRKTSETLQDFEYYYYDSFSGLTLGTTGRVTSYTYDALGNITSVTTPGLLAGPLGHSYATTFTYYDALGRVVGVAAPRRNIEGNLSATHAAQDVEFTPYTEVLYDSFGNVVEHIQHANDAGALDSNNRIPPVVASSSKDHTTLVLRDSANNAIQTQDPVGQQSYASYNARGQVAKEWQYVTNNDAGTEALVTIHEYDKVGQQTAIVQPQVGGSVVVRTNASFNAFGEVTHKGVYTDGAVGAWQENFEYDQAGRLWRTNAGDEVCKVYLYNLAGQMTADIRSQTTNLATVADAATVNGLTGTMRTETVYDLDGHVIQRRQPQFVVNSTQDLIDAQPDIGTIPTTVPPDAIYQKFTVGNNGNYGSVGYGFSTTFYVANPTTWANGGGYQQVSPPDAAHPFGTYTRVAQASYQLVQAKQFHWAATPVLDVVATFKYWPVSSPSSITTVPVYTVSQGQLGANIDALASGQYGYTISYTRVGASTAFATQTGTFDAGTGAVTVSSGTSVAQTATPTTNQVSDRWGNIISVQDAGGGITQYRYNQLGKVIRTLLPSTAVLDTRVTIDQNADRPQITNLYDLAGNLFQSLGGNGSSTQRTFNEAGQVLSTDDPDNNGSGSTGVARYTYDAFGNVIQSTDQLGYRTRNVYDKDGRLTQTAQEIVNTFTSSDPTDLTVSNPANIVVQSYVYDAAGRRLSQTNGENEIVKYWYDLQGNLVRQRSALGFDTTYKYDVRNNKVRETDPSGTYQTWTYDVNGRLTGHMDLNNSTYYGWGGGTTFVYSYNYAGQLTLQTSSLGQHVAYAYDGAGHISTVTDAGVAAGGSGLSNSNSVSTYVYDAAGRTAREKVVVDGRVQEDTRTTYDAMGRIQTLDDPDYRLSYAYDSAGNRTLISTDYLDHQGVRQHQDLYYRYDARNFMVISQGVRSTGVIPEVTITANQGAILSYDAKGQRTGVRTKGTRFVENRYTTNGEISSKTVEEAASPDGLSYTGYQYDGLGRLMTIGKETDLTITETTTGNVTGHYLDSELVGLRTYDKASRVLTDTTYFAENHGLSNQATTSTYDHDGRTATQTTKKNNLLQTTVTFGNSTLNTTTGVWSLGYDNANVLRAYTVAVYQDGTYKYTTNYTNTYRFASTYIDARLTASSTGTGAPQGGYTLKNYNVNNSLIQFTDSNVAANTRYFANDAFGHTLSAIQGQFDGTSGRMSVDQAWAGAIARNTWGGVYNAPKAQYFFYAGGNYIGSYGQLQNPDGSFAANFDVNYTPISSQYPSQTPSKVVVQAGDTLRIIAARVYGDASLWYVIAEKNGLTDPDAKLTAGIQLTIPNEVVSLSNTASSFKPFSASQALGDTTPTQPPPPQPHHSGGKCGGFGQLLLIVVAVVVTIYTAGAAGAAFGAVTTTGTGLGATFAAGATVLTGGATAGFAGAGLAAAAVGGIAGSVVSQGIGIATGIQDGFDWKGVALGAIGAGVTAGVGTAANAIGLANTLGTYGAIAVKAGTSAVISQGIDVATGLQSNFSWRNVAQAAVAAPIAAGVGSAVGAVAQSAFVGKVVGGIAGGFARKAMGGKVDTTSVFIDAFGNSIADSLVDSTVPELHAYHATPQQGSGTQLADDGGQSGAPIPQGDQAADTTADTNNPADAYTSGGPVSGDGQRSADRLQEVVVSTNRIDAGVDTSFDLFANLIAAGGGRTGDPVRDTAASNVGDLAQAYFGLRRQGVQPGAPLRQAIAEQFAVASGQPSAGRGAMLDLEREARFNPAGGPDIPAHPVTDEIFGNWHMQNAIGGVKADIDALVAGPASLLTRALTQPSPDLAMVDPEAYQTAQAASQQLANRVFGTLSLAPSNSDQREGYDGSMMGQMIAGLALGGYSLARAGMGALSNSGYALRSPLLLGDVPSAFGQSGAVNVRLQSPLASLGTGDVYSPDFVGPVQWKYFYRGDATARTEFLSSMAQERGIEATNAFLHSNSAGAFRDIYAAHGVGSQGLPTIGATDSQAVAEYFARGPSQTQNGFVTTFRLEARDASRLAIPNFENPRAFFEPNLQIGSPEREYLFHTQIDPKFIFKQVPVGSK